MTTTFTFSADTQGKIQAAIENGPGVGNVNYFAAYNAMYTEIAQHPEVDKGTAYWFPKQETLIGRILTPVLSESTYLSILGPPQPRRGILLQTLSYKVPLTILL